MKLKAISSSVLLALVPVSGVYAAAMDRSGQSISAFLQPNNYFEGGISALDPSVSGKDTFGGKISDMGEDYFFPSAALKIQATDNISVGLIYDQPFGADAYYSDGRASSGASLAGTDVEVKTNNLTALIGFQPNESINLYAGAAYQDVKGDLTLASVPYKASFKKDENFGWLAGAAYQIPEIALKVSLTYRSEIEHELKTTESIPGLSGKLAYLQANPVAPGPTPEYIEYATALGTAKAMQGVMSGESADTKIKTPQSVNLDFQTGIMANTVAFANVRWVEWGGYGIDIDKFRKLTTLMGKGQNIIDYDKDQWSANVGVGRKFNDQWAGNFSVGWDSGAGNPVTALGPTEGYWNVGLGAQFSPTPATFIAGGVKYFMLGDADGQSAGQPVGKFEDNDALAYGLKMGYKF